MLFLEIRDVPRPIDNMVESLVCCPHKYEQRMAGAVAHFGAQAHLCQRLNQLLESSYRVSLVCSLSAHDTRSLHAVLLTRICKPVADHIIDIVIVVQGIACCFLAGHCESRTVDGRHTDDSTLKAFARILEVERSLWDLFQEG